MPALLAAAIAGLPGTALADIYSWTNARGDGDWSQPENFALGQDGTGGAASAAPGGADEVYIPSETAVVLEYDVNDAAKKASCEAFAAVGKIRPYAGATIDITVHENATLSLSCSLSRGTTEANHNLGHLIKRGAGELDLNAVGKVKGGSEYYDYYCAITVEDGVLRLPQTGADSSIRVGDVTVGENGTLFTAATGSSNSTTFYSLYGGGTITNDYSSTCRMQITARGEFSGRITGRVTYYSSGWLTLTGMESTAPGADSDFTVYMNYERGVSTNKYGSADIAKFGMKAVDGVSTPSSIGYSENVQSRDNGGAFRYIGTGETTDKDLRLWPQTTDYATYLDGGPHGGLVWTGLWGQRDQELRYLKPSMLRLVLQGSNTQECVMSGPIQFVEKNGTNFTFCITKQGTGIWRMVHNDDSDMRGTWRIVNGTLRFDTIAEAGINSALGRSSVLYANVSGLAKDENKVNYAFWLGGGKGGNRADLEYVGDTNCVSSTRRFAVNGTGGILNNGSGFLRLSDFFATNIASTLVLGGTNRLDNVVDALADGGNAQMSVVKEGSGTWRLGTNCTFTGSLDVKAGRLIVGNPYYSWYRWLLKSRFAGGSGAASRTVDIRAFGLFDASGSERTSGLSDERFRRWNSSNYYYSSMPTETPVFNGSETRPALAEGEVMMWYAEGMAAYKANGGGNYVYRTSSTTPANMFDGDTATHFTFWNNTLQSPPTIDDERTWIAFIMRPEEGAPITSWDYVPNSATTHQQPQSSIIAASADGIVWDEVDDFTATDKIAAGKWRFGDGTMSDGAAVPHFGRPIPSSSTNETHVAFAAASVSVAPGAELVANASEKPVIRRLAIDGTVGGGRIDGFAFAPDMALSITNAPAHAPYTVPATIANASGLDGAAGWTVSVDGRHVANLCVSATASGLSVHVVGTQFIIR